MSLSSYYICHYCCTYTTNYKNDMRRHFERKNKCKCNNMLNNYEQSINLSLNKRFIFEDIDITKLFVDDILYIITNYTDMINNIDKNFKNKMINYNKDNNLVLNEINKDEIDMLLDLNNYYNKEDNKYYCKLCNHSFKYKQGLERHILDGKRCEKNRKIKEAIIDNTKNILMIKEKQKIKDNLQSTFIQNNNNTQNIQNNNNNLSNSHNSTYNVDIKDFVHDKYDLSHIKDDYYLQKDFFLYHNLLKTIMENKNNQNIIFSGNDAIIYTDNELNKMSSDKAGYMVLDKLSQSFDQLFYKNSEETQNYYAFIQKYYHVIKGHYKHDTIYKEYDIDDRRFIYTANSRLFRSRDKYLAKIGTSLSKYKDSARENMMISLDEINNIPTINPNIEDFASIKMRYRDLKDKDY